MSGLHHQGTGWIYGPRLRGTCRGCGESKVLTTQNLIINHRQPNSAPSVPPRPE